MTTGPGRGGSPATCPCQRPHSEEIDTMTPDERDPLDFAVKWLPYGGGPGEETMLTFGVTRPQYLRRLDRIISRHPQTIPPTTLEKIKALT